MKEPILVKLKMKKRYKNSLSFLSILIFVIAILGLGYTFYDKVLKDSDIEVNGALSINYINGKSFNIKNKETIKFSVSNASDKVNYYNIGFMKVRGEGSYKIMSDNKLVMEGALNSCDEVITDFVSIDTLETKEYTIEIINKGKNNLKGSLNIRPQVGVVKTFADTILENTKPADDALTKVGEEAALEDEGIIKSSDDLGVSYYFRGNVKNNYVSFANFTWRIVRINGDGTVRMILDDIISESANYKNDESESFLYQDSYINTALENWYQENLRNYTNNIATTNYCNDISHDDANNYLAYNRIMTNKIPTLNCLGNPFKNNIGILSIDEVILAGASPDNTNQNYYLYNPNIKDTWYTMTASSGVEKSVNIFVVDANGNIKTNISGSTYERVRPVINLIKNLEVTGNGTIDNPYKVIIK